MSKITKQDLNERLLMIETLLGLHRKLPEQISNKQANDAIFRMQCALSNGREIAERQPKLKTLDQSVFDGQALHLRWAAVEEDGSVYLFAKKPFIDLCKWAAGIDEIEFYIEDSYDATNWQNSLIERESKELTGSDLCRAMLARGDKWVLCLVANNPKNIDLEQEPDVVISHDENGFYIRDSYYGCAVPINNIGEPLTAKEAGL